MSPPYLLCWYFFTDRQTDELYKNITPISKHSSQRVFCSVFQTTCQLITNLLHLDSSAVRRGIMATLLCHTQPPLLPWDTSLLAIFSSTSVSLPTLRNRDAVLQLHLAVHPLNTFYNPLRECCFTRLAP